MFELGVVWGDGDNNVSDFFVGDEFGEVYLVCFKRLGRTSDLGVVYDDRCVRRNT